MLRSMLLLVFVCQFATAGTAPRDVAPDEGEGMLANVSPTLKTFTANAIVWNDTSQGTWGNQLEAATFEVHADGADIRVDMHATSKSNGWHSTGSFSPTVRLYDGAHNLVAEVVLGPPMSLPCSTLAQTKSGRARGLATAFSTIAAIRVGGPRWTQNVDAC
jgi:hypothetical protein